MIFSDKANNTTILKWIVHAAIHYPEFKLIEFFKFYNENDSLSIGVDNDLLKKWAQDMRKIQTSDLEDPANLAAFKAYNQRETDYMASFGIVYPKKTTFP